MVFRDVPGGTFMESVSGPSPRLAPRFLLPSQRGTNHFSGSEFMPWQFIIVIVFCYKCMQTNKKKLKEVENLPEVSRPKLRPLINTLVSG